MTIYVADNGISGGGITIPLILDDPTATNPVLEIGVTGAAHESVVWDADGSAHFSDGTAAAQVEMALNGGNNAQVGLYPEGGNTSPGFALFGGDITPTGGGTAGGFVIMDGQSNGSGLTLGQDWIGGGNYLELLAIDSGMHLKMISGVLSIPLAAIQTYNSAGHASAKLALHAESTSHPSTTYPSSALEIQGTSSTGTDVPSLIVNYDGSMHWGDGTNPAQVRLVLDTVNQGNDSLGIYPDNGHTATSITTYGGDLLPDGSGTAGAYAGFGTSALDAVFLMGGNLLSAAPVLRMEAGTSGGVIQSFLSLVDPSNVTTALLKIAPDGSAHYAASLGLLINASYSGTPDALTVGVQGGAIKFRVNHAGGFAAFGHTAPTSQPATPLLLSDIVTILQNYGMCA